MFGSCALEKEIFNLHETIVIMFGDKIMFFLLNDNQCNFDLLWIVGVLKLGDFCKTFL